MLRLLSRKGEGWLGFALAPTDLGGNWGWTCGICLGATGSVELMFSQRLLQSDVQPYISVLVPLG